MKLSKEKEGEFFIFGQAALWALFPVITILSYNKVSPLISLAVSSMFAAVFFAVILSIKKKWHEVKNASAFKDILRATFFIGILYYLFYFLGLRYTSAGNASIIVLTEILFSYLFFNLWKKDPLPLLHIVGAVLMMVGALTVLYPNVHKFQPGDILVLIAAIFPAFGNFFARRARSKVSSETIMFVRSLISGVIIFLIAFIFGNTFSFPDFKASFILLFINGVFLLGLSKVMWIEGIHRISVVKANALGSVGPLLTLLFAWLFLRNIPTPWQLFSFIPMFLGVILLSMNKNNNR
jgi:drug/metabolite transporter (DMT)-like permease